MPRMNMDSGPGPISSPDSLKGAMGSPEIKKGRLSELSSAEDLRAKMMGGDPDAKPESSGRFIASAEKWKSKASSLVVEASKFLKDSVLTNEQLKSNLLMSSTFALLRAGAVWGTGGFGLGVSMGWGAGAGAIKGGFQEIHQQYAEQKKSLKDRIEADKKAGVVDSADLVKEAELGDKRLLDIWGKFKAVEDKKAVGRAVVRGAAFGALGAAIGFEVKEMGVADFIKDKVGGFVSGHTTKEKVYVGLSATMGGASGGLVESIRAIRGKNVSFKRSGMTVLAGAVLGAGVGEMLVPMMPDPSVSVTDIDSSPIKPEVGSPKPVLTPEAIVPAEAVPSTEAPKGSNWDPRNWLPGWKGQEPAPAVVPSPQPEDINSLPNDSSPAVEGPKPNPAPPPSPVVTSPPLDAAQRFEQELTARKIEFPPELNDARYATVKDFGDLSKELKTEGWTPEQIRGLDNSLRDLTEVSVTDPDIYSQQVFGDPDISSLKGLIEDKVMGEVILEDQNLKHDLITKAISTLDPNNQGDKDIIDALNRMQSANVSEFDHTNGAHKKLLEQFQKEPEYSKLFNRAYLESKWHTPPSSFSNINPDLFKHGAPVKIPQDISGYRTYYNALKAA